MKKVFMFSGQGSQYYHMGEYLYHTNSSFRRYMEYIDTKIISLYGKSMLSILYDPTKKKSDPLTNILHANLAIFMFSWSIAMVLKENKIEPDYIIGSSMGEICGATVAGSLQLEQTLDLLIKQGSFVEQCVPRGGLLSVFEDVSVMERYSETLGSCQVAAVNHKRNFVISAIDCELEKAIKLFNRLGIMYQRLAVLYPFHSDYIDGVKNQFCEFFQKLTFSKPMCQILSCSTGDFISNVNPDLLWDVLRKPILLQECVARIDDKQCIYIDLSASGEMSGILRYILSSDRYVYKVSSIFNSKLSLDMVISAINEVEARAMVSYVFTGQGSQKVGMGKDLFDQFPEYVDKANRVLGYSIKELCLSDPEHKLHQTKYTQPALYVVSALDYLKRIKEGTPKPGYLAGHSIGEFVALFAADVYSFEVGLQIVNKRASLMSLAKGGGMAAVIGLTKERVESILKMYSWNDIDIANLNTSTQIVLSGPKNMIIQAEESFKRDPDCQSYVILNVSGAFHSRYMKPFQKELSEYIEQFELKPPSIPVISNYTARPYRGDNIKENLIQQLSSSVRWNESIQYIIREGVDEITQLGPGRITQNLVDKILRDEKKSQCNANKKKDITITSGTNSFKSKITAKSLGSTSFCNEYGVKYSCVLGGMYKGISGVDMVTAAAREGFLAFFGAGGLSISSVEMAIKSLQQNLQNGEPYGINFLSHNDGIEERELYNLLIKYNIHIIEASSYVTITNTLVKYRLHGIEERDGKIYIPNRIIAKLSRPEVAEEFMSPPPQEIVDDLLKSGEITLEQAKLSQKIPMAYDICIEADSGGHTDRGNIFNLLPAIQALRDRLEKKYEYNQQHIRIGVAGGIGTPVSASAMFLMGADFIMTGSINQCTIEAKISSEAKNMLANINVQDTAYCPAGDSFEYGSEVQVLKKGSLFPMRANKLYALYTTYNSLDEIPFDIKKRIEEKFFQKSFHDVWNEVEKHYSTRGKNITTMNAKQKMAAVFKWYFAQSTQYALDGIPNRRADFQIQCGPSLGAFNQWVKGTEIEPWNKRKVAKINLKLMEEAALYLSNSIHILTLKD